MVTHTSFVHEGNLITPTNNNLLRQTMHNLLRQTIHNMLRTGTTHATHSSILVIMHAAVQDPALCIVAVLAILFGLTCQSLFNRAYMQEG